MTTQEIVLQRYSPRNVTIFSYSKCYKFLVIRFTACLRQHTRRKSIQHHHQPPSSAQHITRSHKASQWFDGARNRGLVKKKLSFIAKRILFQSVANLTKIVMLLLPLSTFSNSHRVATLCMATSRTAFFAHSLPNGAPKRFLICKKLPSFNTSSFMANRERKIVSRLLYGRT